MNADGIAALCTGAGTLLTAIGTLRNHQVAKNVQGTVEDVQTKVNGVATAQVARVEQLADTLTAAGLDVPSRPPEDPAAPPVEDPAHG